MTRPPDEPGHRKDNVVALRLSDRDLATLDRLRRKAKQARGPYLLSLIRLADTTRTRQEPNP